MTQRDKLLLSAINNPQSVRFEDACKIAVHLGFIYVGGKGSHRVFKRPGEPVQLNFQNRNGYIPSYQAKHLKTMIEKYGDLS